MKRILAPLGKTASTFLKRVELGKREKELKERGTDSNNSFVSSIDLTTAPSLLTSLIKLKETLYLNQYFSNERNKDRRRKKKK